MSVSSRDQRAWWRDAVTYQIYIRSFADGNGDGIGDVEGIRSKLPYLKSLGVDAIWITPWYPSPQNDHGYDVANYMDIEPMYGTLEDAQRLIDQTHELGMKLIVDIVPNHSSDQHVWFQEALKSPIGSKARDRYIFRDGKGANGELPPNNWQSVFGGPAWHRLVDINGNPSTNKPIDLSDQYVDQIINLAAEEYMRDFESSIGLQIAQNRTSSQE